MSSKVKRYVAAVGFIVFGLLFFQNFAETVPGAVGCAPNVVAAPIQWKGFPKLFFTGDQLGRAVSCARSDLKDELINTAALLYNFNLTNSMNPRVDMIGGDPALFFTYASGTAVSPQSSPEATEQLLVNLRNPGDARMVQRLAAAAFFASPSAAANYRTLAKTILLHWATVTFKASDMTNALALVDSDADSGLILASSVVAFAGAYDMLAASGMFRDLTERQLIENWFRRIKSLIVRSNNMWLTSCKDGLPFSYDGTSCERAMGDNHVSVATAGIYVLAVMTGNRTTQAEAIQSSTAYKWGFYDRLPYIIYNANDKVASPDRFPTVHTGEIYDRWRGHYQERVRGLQLHRSFSYPFLNMGFLTVQALAAKRQGANLLLPVTKTNLKSISLEKSYLHYRLYLEAYDPKEIMDPNHSRITLDSAANYMSLTSTYCVSGFSPIPTDANCELMQQRSVLQPGINDLAYTDAYYYIVFAGAHALMKDSNATVDGLILKVLTPTKMAFANNAFSPHIFPFEPALLIEGP